VNTDGPKSGFYTDFIVGGVPSAEVSLSRGDDGRL
jgi:hypothetical protein